MTVHGDQCFDKIENILNQVGTWMKAHPRDVIVIYFGELRLVENLSLKLQQQKIKLGLLKKCAKTLQRFEVS